MLGIVGARVERMREKERLIFGSGLADLLVRLCLLIMSLYATLWIG